MQKNKNWELRFCIAKKVWENKRNSMTMKIHIHSYHFSKRVFPKTAEYLKKEVQPTNILWRCCGQLSTLFNDGRGVLIQICSKAVRSQLDFWWSWWWWWWQWWRTLSHIDGQNPICGILCIWDFGRTPWWRLWWWEDDGDDGDDDGVMMMVAILMIMMMWGWSCDQVLYGEAGPYKRGNASDLFPLSRDFTVII